MLEANEVGALHRPVRFGTHTDRSHPGVNEPDPKRKYWRLLMKAEDFQKVLLLWYP